MKTYDTASGIKRNFMSDEEFNTIKELCDKIKDWPEVGKTSKYYGMSYNDSIGKIIRKIFCDKLNDLIGDHELDFFVFQEAIKPWQIHADIRWYQDKIPHKTVCIPLDVISDNEQWVDTHTITFKQRDYFRNNPDTNEGSYGNKSNMQRYYDNANTENLCEGYKISKEQHKKHFSHMPYNYLKGLEIDSIKLWEPKSAICWDQNQLHCSDNFLTNNVQTKKSLIFFTNIKPNSKV